MKSHFSIFILLAAGLVLSGCAGMTKPKPYVSDPEHSFAWNVARAGGIEVKDVPWEKVQKAQEEALAKGAPAGDSGPSALGAATFGVVHGLSMGSFLHGGLGVLSFLSTGTGNKPDPRRMSTIFVWMPKKMAANSEEAGAQISEMVRNAYEKALSETKFPLGYTVSTEKKTVIVKERFKRKGYFVTGNEVEIDKIDARYREVRLPYVMKPFRPYPVTILPEVGISPDFISLGETWTYKVTVFGRSYLDLTSSPAQYLPKLPDFEVYRRMSEMMPEWVKIYLSPASYISMSDGNGGFTFLKYPLILNQGKAHLFVEPKPKNI